MAGVTTTGSATIAVLDSKIIASLCTGKFYVDVTPSIYIADGADNVLGANVQITNPQGVVVKPFGSNYEIAPALSGGMDAVISFNIPTVAGTYQYGKYKIDVDLYDDVGNKFTITKYVTICAPDKKNQTKNFGSLSALMKAVCKAGKLYIVVDPVPNYKGTVVESQVNDLLLKYPTESELDPLESDITNWSVLLYEGEYKLSGEICATYNFGDNVYAEVKYKVKKNKIAKCILDECCVFAKLEELHARTKTDCSDKERNETASIILDALRLLKTAQLAAECSEDASSYVEELEALLGCKCTCNCEAGVPISPENVSSDVSITGCNVTQETVGQTTVYTINNYEYKVTVVENGGVFVISEAVLEDCIKVQQITFNISAAYAQIKILSNQNDTEGDFWASVINKSLRAVNPSCLNYTDEEWVALTFAEKIAAITSKMCSCCGECESTVEVTGLTKDGNNVIIEFETENARFVDFYLDGVYKGQVIVGDDFGINTFTFIGAANGANHTYLLVSRCANYSVGGDASAEFNELGCPDIAKPTVTDTNVVNADCPFDLTSIEDAPPAGITNEWRSSNDSSAISNIVADPTKVSAGVYFLFAKNADNCYSQGTQVIVTCSETSCSAPQNPVVKRVVHLGAKNIISFQSAVNPPPGNSYTVKRRKASDPDVPGSYTVIGTPIWNPSFSVWQIEDNPSPASNTLWVYRCQSNCGDSPETTPYADVEFVHINCPAIEYTPADVSIDYSLTPVGGDVDKYEVEIWNEGLTTLIHTDTHLPVFSNPITGTFEYLDPETTYHIIIKVHVDDNEEECDGGEVTTTAAL